ncbi:MAG: ABC transporter substrate-binding protein [Chloroflexi bacterium]|nr:ABC transporter substrate-binding protein [Chloroflexota bacterium]
MSTKRHWYLPVLLTLTIMVSACGSGSATTAAPVATQPAATTAPASGEPVVMKIGSQFPPDTLNPAYAFLAASYTIFDLVYSSLVKEGLDGQYYGDLAASWSHSDDNLTWTFTLKDNIKYHNGTPLTAEDVAWSINEIHNDPEGWATLVNYTNGFKEITALDDKTVQITLDYPISNMEYRVSFLYALWRADFEPLDTTEALQNFTNDQLIGSGAFSLKTWEKDQNVLILDADPDFYDGRPVVDQLIFQTFDNSDALVQALKVGDIDVINLVPNSAFETVKTFDNVVAVNLPSRSFDELIVNSVRDDNDTAPTGNPALKDPQVKLAIAQAINKQDLVDIVFQGLGKPGWSIVAPALGGGFWHNSNVQDVQFDPAKANQILDDAGYAKGADGIREKDGVRLEMRLQYDATSSEYARDADLISNWLKDIGIKASPEAVDADTLIAATTGVGDYDLVIWGWGGDPDPDFILSIMLCDQFVVGGWSDSGYCNSDYDQLYLDQQKSGDPADRQQIIWKMQEMLFKDNPYIVLYNYDDLYAYRSDRFTNFQLDQPNANITDALVLQHAEPVK